MKKFIKVFLVTLFFSVNFYAQKELTISEAVETTLENNLDIKISKNIEKHKTNFKGVGQPLRIALVGSRFGPGLYDVILSLDKAEVVKRLKQI